MRRATIRKLVAISSLVSPGFFARADTIDWIAGEGTWSIANNWLDEDTGQHVVPGSADDVILSGDILVSGGDALCRQLTLEGGTSVLQVQSSLVSSGNASIL